jgi:hypothetical protein
MRLAFVIALIGIAAIAFGAPTASMPGPGGAGRIWVPLDDPSLSVKWVQTPNGLNGLSSQQDDCYPFFSQAADDFLCGESGDILAIEWWGSFSDPFVPPAAGHYFMIEFWSDNPGPPSHPEQLLYSEACYVFTEDFDPDYNQYHYVQYLDVPFFQEEGLIYWISIYDVFCFPPQYYWCTGEPPWNDCASFKSEFFGFPEWTESPVVFGECYDLAFVLYGEIPVPVEDKTWGSIKALYQ